MKVIECSAAPSVQRNQLVLADELEASEDSAALGHIFTSTYFA